MLRRSPIIDHHNDGGFEINLASSLSLSTPPSSPKDSVTESLPSPDPEGTILCSEKAERQAETTTTDASAEIVVSVPEVPTPGCQPSSNDEKDTCSQSPPSSPLPALSDHSTCDDETPDTPISRYRKENQVFRESAIEEDFSTKLTALTPGVSHPLLLPMVVTNRRHSNSWSMSPLSLDSRLALEISAARQMVVQHGGGVPTTPLTISSTGALEFAGLEEAASVSSNASNNGDSLIKRRIEQLQSGDPHKPVESDHCEDEQVRSYKPLFTGATQPAIPTTSWINKSSSILPPPSPLSPYGKIKRHGRRGPRRLQEDRSKSLVDEEDFEDDMDQGETGIESDAEGDDETERPGSNNVVVRSPDWEEKKESLELPALLEEESSPQTDSPLSCEIDGEALISPIDARRSMSPNPLSTSGSIEHVRRRPKFPLVRAATTGQIPLELQKTISLTESDVGSLDGLPPRLKSRWGNEFGTEKALHQIDGIPNTMAPRTRRASTPIETQIAPTLRPSRIETNKSAEQPPSIKQTESFSFFSNWPLKLLLGENEESNAKDKDSHQPVLGVPGCCRQDDETSRLKSRWRDEDDSLALLACANLIHQRPAPSVQTSLIRVTSEPPPLSYSQVYAATHRLHDPRMPAWVEHQFRARDKSSKDGQYLLGKSRAVIVHEIVRGNWTWATAWSPDGSQLAVATENHHLAVLDTTSSTVWRVRHDKKLQGPVKLGTTHSIRSIAWGSQYIAIGGTGNAVSLLAPVEPFLILHTIQNCGFVGSLAWRPDSCDLAIGSRLDRAMVVRVRTSTQPTTAEHGFEQQQKVITCDTLQVVDRKHWVHAVSFSPSGAHLAIGDAGGSLLLFDYVNHNDGDSKYANNEVLKLIKTFTLDDAVLAVEWSPEGSWLYAGGEDFAVTVIETKYWEVVHKIKRDRWVQCIAASNSGTHIAVGGVSSEVSLLETKSGWDSVMGIELNGLVPLSATWHPRDQFLSLTGQNNSIIVVETTNARHVNGHHLHSVGGVLAVEFSPDGRMAVVGNDSGVITFYSLSGSTFVTSYELVVKLSSDRLSIKWSLNGLFVVVATRDTLLVVGRRKRDRYGKALPPKCSGFSVRKVVQDLQGCHAVSIDFQSQYVSLCGSKGTSVLDASRDFGIIREWPSGPCYATAWSPLGRWLATIGKDKVLTIFDTSEERVDRWRAVFSVTCDYVGRALAWGPLIVGGLLYLAIAGDGNEITVMEIRTQEGTWETVMRIQRSGAIHALDWHMDGLLAAAIANGTVSIVDLAYLQSGIAVNEMDYNWQRQALTSFTEIRRNRATNKMRAVRWIPSAPGSDSLLAVGGTDGELEIIDLTERQRCRGYLQKR